MTFAVRGEVILARYLLSAGVLLTAACDLPNIAPAPDGSFRPRTTVPLCLDCLRLVDWVPPDDVPPPDLRAILYVTYDNERHCAQRLFEALGERRIDLDRLLPEQVYLGLRFDDGPFVYVEARLVFNPAQGDPDRPARWSITLGADQLAPFEGDLAARPEIDLRGPCNSSDDNCDGVVDGDIPTPCGDGPCSAEGTWTCIDGQRILQCVERRPAFEICDGLDNDCDGVVDRGACFDGPIDMSFGDELLGVCRVGQLRCERGVEVCEGQVTAGLEAPDRGIERVDEDCDGFIDEESVACGNCGSSVSLAVDPASTDLHRLVVSLSLPADIPADDLDARRIGIAAVAADVIESLRGIAVNEGFEFRLVRQFTWVPAFVVEADGPMQGHIVRHANVLRATRDLTFEPALAGATARVRSTVARRQSSATGRGVRVAVLDTGIEYDHAAFGHCGQLGDDRCAIIDGYDAVDDDDDPTDHRTHGTDIAQIIAGRGAGGVPAGVAPEAELVILRVVGEDGRADLSTIIAALDWLIGRPDLNVRVINMSLQTVQAFTPASCAVAGGVLETVFSDLRSRGALTFAAAGNTGRPRELSLGACGPSVVAVGSTYAQDEQGVRIYPGADCEDERAVVDMVPCFSSGQAAWPPFVGLMAPGGVTLQRGGAIASYAEGTSVSSAIASGAAAAALSARPEDTPDDVLESLFDTGQPVGAHRGLRRVDIGAATARACPDLDGDGAGAGPGCSEPADCDDSDPDRAPHHEEVIGGSDEDCDGVSDEADACEMLAIREANLVVPCNATPGTPEMLEACLANGIGACPDEETLVAFCTRDVPGMREAWLEVQVPAMEAQYPGLCQRWSSVLDADGPRRMYCVEFAPGICRSSVLMFE